MADAKFRTVPFSWNFGILPSAVESRRTESAVFFSTTPLATFKRCASENSPIIAMVIYWMLWFYSIELQWWISPRFKNYADPSMLISIGDESEKNVDVKNIQCAYLYLREFDTPQSVNTVRGVFFCNFSQRHQCFSQCKFWRTWILSRFPWFGVFVTYTVLFKA